MEPFVSGKMCSFLKEFSIIHKPGDFAVHSLANTEGAE